MNPTKEVIVSKISNIENCLNRIKEITNNNPVSLENVNVQDIFILNLQRALRAVMQITNIIITDNNYEKIPSESVFNFLKENNWIDEDISIKMQNLFKSRKIADIYEYQYINPDLLKQILLENLIDLKEFCRQILLKYES